MSSNWNEYTYAKQFEGNLRGSSEPVPMRVNTSLRMMSQEMVQELLEAGPSFKRRAAIRFHAA